MNSNDTLKLQGNLSIVLTDAQGRVKDTREVKNLVVTAGITHILGRLGASAPAQMGWMALGSGAVAAAAANTDLGAIIGSRVALTSTTPGATNIVYVCNGFTAGVSTGAVTEAGIFNNATSGAGTMLCRTVFPVVNKQAGDSISITWTITLTAV